MQYGAPARFNITPEQFAIIAQGGSLPQEHIESLLAGNAAAPAEGVTTIAAPSEPATTNAAPTATTIVNADVQPAVAEAKKEKKSSKTSSKKLSSTKKAKGCC